jgi:hypothetical protein
MPPLLRSVQGVEAATLASTVEELRQPTAAWVAAKEAEIRVMRAELAELREFQRQALEAEERVRHGYSAGFVIVSLASRQCPKH